MMVTYKKVCFSRILIKTLITTLYVFLSSRYKNKNNFFITPKKRRFSWKLPSSGAKHVNELHRNNTHPTSMLQIKLLRSGLPYFFIPSTGQITPITRGGARNKESPSK